MTAFGTAVGLRLLTLKHGAALKTLEPMGELLGQGLAGMGWLSNTFTVTLIE